jgi:hypothetical protein
VVEPTKVGEVFPAAAVTPTVAVAEAEAFPASSVVTKANVRLPAETVPAVF